MSNIEILQDMLPANECAALITSDVSRRYFCGFKSSAGVILVTKEQAYLIIDSRYFDKAKQKVRDCRVILMEDMRTQLSELLLKHNIRSLMTESDYMTLTEFADYREKLHFVELDPSPALSDFILNMRIIKSDEELSLIIKAQRIAEKAFERLIDNISRDMTEKQVAALLNYYMMDCGADDLSFETIAASGINSASPHAVPTDKKLCEGEFLTLDFGAVVDSYHSDMTRTLAVGQISPEMEKVYEAVYYANIDGIKAIRPGINGKVVDSVARSTLSAWGGYDRHFGHGLGHGVGLEIHEQPTLSQKSRSMLKPGMIVTIEPGVYISGCYGVRIEDMAVVTENGCDVLTKSTKKLIHI